MKTRADIRRELEMLAQDIAQSGIGAVPMVAQSRRVGEDGEARAPGLYREGPGGRVPVVVYEGEFPDDAALRRYFPGAEPLPLFIGGAAIAALL